MELVAFKNVLSKSLDIVSKGIEKGYFDSNKSEELNNKLITMFNNGIVYDLPGTAIYGMYSPSEKKLYFNAKVFKTEEEALVYILHEIKHGLDHYDNSIGYHTNEKGVGSNEGATQRFATDMAEAILNIKIPKKIQKSLGIEIETHLDEYQIEDKMNEFFCIAMGISMENFIKMQNDPEKKEFNKLIEKFNKYADYNIFSNSLDEIYKIQEETWIDEEGNILEEEKKPTENQMRRTIDLIKSCKHEIISYAQKVNTSVIDKITQEDFFVILDDGTIILTNTTNPNSNIEEMREIDIIKQSNYLQYQQIIQNQINNEIFNNECSIVFVTEFGYDEDKDDKIILFRKGEIYYKMTVPVLENLKLDITNINIQKIDNKDEMKNLIEYYELEFEGIANLPEYAKVLYLIEKTEEAKKVLNKWKYYVSKQNELDEIRHKNEESGSALKDFMSEFRAMLDSDAEEKNIKKVK